MFGVLNKSQKFKLCEGWQAELEMPRETKISKLKVKEKFKFEMGIMNNNIRRGIQHAIGRHMKTATPTEIETFLNSRKILAEVLQKFILNSPALHCYKYDHYPKLIIEKTKSNSFVLASHIKFTTL
uniref:Uncharacterized protein n=1 Tax=Panagrolaimus sp. JU765 TaxID=591449 RepID=A0AC34Q7J8_9BILA